MWEIENFPAPGATQCYACDGLPILETDRGSDAGVCRIVVAPFGYIDFRLILTVLFGAIRTCCIHEFTH